MPLDISKSYRDSHLSRTKRRRTPRNVINICLTPWSHGKTFDSIAIIICDIKNVINAFAKRAAKTLLGCASHRFKIVVKDFLGAIPGIHR